MVPHGFQFYKVGFEKVEHCRWHLLHTATNKDPTENKYKGYIKGMSKIMKNSPVLYMKTFLTDT